MYNDCNELPDNKYVVTSKSGNYSVIVQVYDITKDIIYSKIKEYTKGTVINNTTGEEIITIHRNYNDFLAIFFVQNGTEWLLCGKTHSTQSFIDLDNKIVYDNKDPLYWSKVYFNPSKTTLLIEGEILGDSSGLFLYDISNIPKGWKMIDFDDEDIIDICYYDYKVKWIDDDTVQLKSYRTKEEYLDDTDFNHDLDLGEAKNNFLDEVEKKDKFIAYTIKLVRDGKLFASEDYTESLIHELYNELVRVENLQYLRSQKEF